MHLSLKQRLLGCSLHLSRMPSGSFPLSLLVHLFLLRFTGMFSYLLLILHKLISFIVLNHRPLLRLELLPRSPSHVQIQASTRALSFPYCPHFLTSSCTVALLQYFETLVCHGLISQVISFWTQP